MLRHMSAGFGVLVCHVKCPEQVCNSAELGDSEADLECRNSYTREALAPASADTEEGLLDLVNDIAY